MQSLSSARRRLRGFTLIELLVVIAICSLLVALTLVAVHRVRLVAARAECGNKLRQLHLATDQYHLVKGQLPAGFVTTEQPKGYVHSGWPVRLLPYLERNDVWRQAEGAFRTDPDRLTFYGHKPHAEVLATLVPAFQCPSDPRVKTARHFDAVGEVAFTSYLGVSGTNYIQRNGLLFADSALSWSNIPDGTSNTLLFGERPPSADFRLGWWYRGWGLYKDGTGEMVLGVKERNFTADYRECPAGPYAFREGKVDHNCDLFHFWAMHAGGGNFAFADGSVRYLTYSSESVLPAMATRAAGDSVPAH